MSLLWRTELFSCLFSMKRSVSDTSGLALVIRLLAGEVYQLVYQHTNGRLWFS